ncbi:MAG: ankyrin repeat domain-containing protein [Gammaproteobacteria bacterium]|nr:ankyrin repeat domain-containing protein [Gammaproteobacteria bacterium]MYF37607.1 ankyrin repeat domain-containing protein [Gammaproteobacteria bacterium]
MNTQYQISFESRRQYVGEFITKKNSRRSNLRILAILGIAFIGYTSLVADDQVQELEIPPWTTIDFYDAIDRNDATKIQEYLSDTERATKEYLSYYLLDYALELERDHIARLMVEAGAGVSTLSAVQHENEEVLEEMLRRDVEPHGAALAAERGNVHMLNLLLSYGDDDLSTVGAAKNGQLQALKLLIKQGAEPEGLGMAILYGHEEIVKLLLNSGANPNKLTRHYLGMHDLEFDVPSRYTFEYLTPLHYAVLRQSRELVDLLLEHGADPNFTPTAVTLKENASGREVWPTVLQAATDLQKDGDRAITKLLKKSGASKSTSVDDEDIPLERQLYRAADERDYEAVIGLLEAGAQPTGFGEFYYGHSKQYYKPQIVTAFFDAGADPEIFRGDISYMYTPTALTLQNRDIENFRRFVKAGFNREEQLMSWYMKIACVNGLNEAMETLWELGMSRGPWELVIPINYDHVHTVKFLLAKGAKPEFLRRAVTYEHVEIVRMLLEAGADPNEADSHDERSILEIAIELENDQIASMLRIAGASE